MDQKLKVSNLTSQSIIGTNVVHLTTEIGNACAKRPAHGNMPQEKPGPKTKETKLNFVAT